MTVRKRIWVEGRVQGVAFRAVTTATARELGLCGWVANRDDGSVEAVAEGDEGAVAALIQWCHQGPPGARVIRVEVRDDPGHSALPDPFTIRYGG
jgi:acylphosphatase